MVDLLLDSNGDFALVDDGLALVDGVEELRQSVIIALQLFLGEYAFDEDEGIDYLGQILVKDPDLTAIRSIIQAKIYSVPGVEDITDYTQTLGADRLLSIDVTILGDDGEVTLLGLVLDPEGAAAAVLGGI